MTRLRVTAALVSTLAAGCTVLAPSTPTAVPPTHARMVAADDAFASGLAGARASVLLEAINGTPTGAWRLDRGAGAAPAGAVNLLVGLWVHDKLLPLAGPDTFACLRFKAEPQTIYTVAAVTTGHQYTVVVHNTSFNPSHQVATFEVTAKGQTTPPACGRPD